MKNNLQGRDSLNPWGKAGLGKGRYRLKKTDHQGKRDRSLGGKQALLMSAKKFRTEIGSQIRRKTKEPRIVTGSGGGHQDFN